MKNLFSFLLPNPKPLNPAQRIKKGEEVSIEEITDYLKKTLPPEEQKKFFTNIQISVYPVVVQKLLEFKDKGELSEVEFFKHLREQTEHINQLLDEEKNHAS